MDTVPLMRGKSLINTLVGVSASWYCEEVGGDDSKENAKHQHEGNYGEQYSSWKGVAATVRVRLATVRVRLGTVQIFCKCASKYLLCRSYKSSVPSNHRLYHKIF